MKKLENSRKWSEIVHSLTDNFNQRVGAANTNDMEGRLGAQLSINQYRRMRIGLAMAFDEKEIPKFAAMNPTNFRDIGDHVSGFARKRGGDHSIPTRQEIVEEKRVFLEQLDTIARR